MCKSGRWLIAAATMFAASSIARADTASFGDAVKKTAQPIAVQNGKLAGKGGEVLRTAIAAAQFVMLGEDHGIEQIPALAGAVCTELAPHGFHRLALEVGPSVAPELARFASAADGPMQAAAFGKKYPETIAFYDWKEELGFLQTCAKATGATPLEIWGLDQELMGATGFVLQQILDTKPGPKARAAIEALARDNETAHAEAAKTGDFGALFLMKAKQSALDAAKALLAKEGSADAQAKLAALLESRTIYQGQAGPAPYLSNRQRARLMKGTFLDDLTAAAKTDKSFPKVFLKLGGWHLYRGLNPLRSSEIGNLVAEAAEGHKVVAVNLLVLGLKGQQLRPAGVARAPAAVPLDLAGDPDSDFKFLAPFFAAQVAKSWTLYDLRALRPNFSSYGKQDPEIERLVFGYDFLVVIADPRPAHPLP